MGSFISVILLLVALGLGAAFGEWNGGMALCLSYIVAGVAGGLLQQLWFSFGVMTKMAYPGRFAGFGLSYFVVLALCATFGGWLPADNSGAWVIFSLLYLAIFAVLTIAFSAWYRHKGSSYRKMLAEYRRQQSGDTDGSK